MGKLVIQQGLIFELYPDKAVLKSWDRSRGLEKDKEIHVPTIVEDKPVTEIADGAFFQCSATKWCLPATIGKIGNRAFGSSAVEQITFYATSAYPYKGIIRVGNRTFLRCKSLKIFATMQQIAAEECAFCSCPNLTTEPLRYEMRFIEMQRGAIAGCKNLDEIFIAAKANLSDGAFQDSALQKIHFDKNVSVNQSIVNFIKDNDVSIVTSSKSALTDLAYDGINVEIVEEK